MILEWVDFIGCLVNDGTQTEFGFGAMGNLCRIGHDDDIGDDNLRGLLDLIVNGRALGELLRLEACVAADEVIQIQGNAENQAVADYTDERANQAVDEVDVLIGNN